MVDARDSDDVNDGPGKQSSTLSSIGEDIDWAKLLIRQLFDAIDSSPSVIEPNAESWDGLQLLLKLLLLHVLAPRIEYSIRRLLEFFEFVDKSIVNWLDVDAGEIDGMVKFSLALSFEAFGELLLVAP